MEELGVEQIHGRPIGLFQLADWGWEEPNAGRPFTLLVAASVSGNEAEPIRQFASNAVASGCVYVCAWGDGCERVHDLFDEASIAADRFVMSTWHAEDTLAEALYFALVTAWPEDASDPASSPVILAVEAPWVADVRRLVADQDALARLWTAKGK